MGAQVTSQTTTFYTEANLHCSVHFQVPDPEMAFLIQVVSLDLPDPEQESSQDSLNITEDPGGQPSMLLHSSRGTQNTPKVIQSSPGSAVRISWRTGNTVQGSHRGFVITLTAVLPLSACTSGASDVYYACASTGHCVSKSLVCDTISHCPNGEDESSCPLIERIKRQIIEAETLSSTISPPPSHNASSGSLSPSTPSYMSRRPRLTSVPPQEMPTGQEESSEMFQEVDMVSIIVVGVLFIVILMICIVLACRSKGGDMEPLSEESNQLRLDVSTNMGTSEVDGAPGTPPPTYSMIERQTSYVSQISVSSSQVSEPPNYEEALELDEHGNPRPRRTSSRHSSSRNSSHRSGHPAVRTASGYVRNYQRGAGHSRYRRTQSDSGDRPRFLSQNSAISEVVPIEEHSGDSGQDDIFVNIPDDPSALQGTTAHPTSSNTDAPTGSGQAASDQGPVTSTPDPPLGGYSIEVVREDSSAPLFHLNDTTESSSDDSNSANSTPRRGQQQTSHKPDEPDPV